MFELGSFLLNRFSPQDIVEQESKLAEKNKLTDDLHNKINRLQAEVLVAQHHFQKQLRDQSEMQSQAEALQCAEQQAKVALECISARVKATSFTAGPSPEGGTPANENKGPSLVRAILRHKHGWTAWGSLALSFFGASESCFPAARMEELAVNSPLAPPAFPCTCLGPLFQLWVLREPDKKEKSDPEVSEKNSYNASLLIPEPPNPSGDPLL